MNVAERLARISQRMNREGFQARLGECYANAGRYVVDHEEFDLGKGQQVVLVHGSIELVGEPIDHAWAVVNENGSDIFVYEPTTDSRWEPDEYREVFGAKERVRYDREVFLATLLSVCHWGPFDVDAKAATYASDREAIRQAKEAMVGASGENGMLDASGKSGNGGVFRQVDGSPE